MRERSDAGKKKARTFRGAPSTTSIRPPKIMEQHCAEFSYKMLESKVLQIDVKPVSCTTLTLVPANLRLQTITRKQLRLWPRV